MTTTEPVKKPIWTRCKGPEGKGNGCGQRVFNAPVDIEKHRQHCPADLEREVDALEKRVAKLEKTEIPEQLDLDDVSDEWPGAAAPALPEQVSQYADEDVSRTLQLPPAVAAQDDLDEDDVPAPHPPRVADYFQHPTALT